MKISMIGPVYPYRGGIAQYTTSLALALQGSGHSLQMISFKRQYPAILYPGQNDKDPSAHPIRIETQYLLDPLYPWTWVQAVQAIERHAPDLVLIQWWTTFWGPAYTFLAGALRRRRTVAYIIHNVLPHELRPWDRHLARLALGQAHAFITQAPHERDKLLRLIPGAHISYCNLPVYRRFSEEIIPKETARRQLGLPLDRAIWLFFGIVRPYKGLKYLIEAMGQLRAPIHLVVAGEFWQDLGSFEKQIEALGLSGRVTLINKYIPDEEAHVLFSAADGLVAPYVGGTQSAAVGVSLGYGLPAVVTEQVAAGIDPGTPGVQVVPAGNAAALAVAMERAAAEDSPPTPNPRPEDPWLRLVGVIEQLSGLPFTRGESSGRSTG